MDRIRFWQASPLIAMLTVSPAYGVEDMGNPSPNEAWLGVGTGGEFDDVNVSLGTRFLQRWGLLVASTHNQEFDDDELVNGPAPVTNVTVIDEDARTSPTYGIEALYFMNLGSGSVYLGGGIYVGERCKVVASNLTGFQYCQDREDEVAPGGSVGFRYGRIITYGTEASTARGVSVGVGYRW